jgi:ATP-binding cassette subfamily F protein 3
MPAGARCGARWPVSLLTFSEVYKAFGRQEVLRGASFFVAPGRKVGLIGPNGAGKSTALRLAAGSETVDRGRIALQPGARVAVLEQDPLAGDPRTVLHAAQRPTPELQAAWDELTALEAAFLHHAEALDRYDTVHHRFQDLGGYDCENRAREVLVGLGFAEDSWDRPVKVLSGGERTRLALVQLLVRQPDLLLLDEPTNHVDWAACEWLQDYLRRYPGAALIVSHDRTFLNETVDEIVELDQGRARVYRGNYDSYLQRKVQEREQQEEAFRRHQEEMKRQEEIIQRLRSHRKFNSMHSRERTLEKLRAVAPDRPDRDARRVRMRVRQGDASGREVLIARDLEAGFGERSLFRHLSLTLERGERLAIVGPNGAGKTTLLRALAGEAPPRVGSVSYGYRVQPGYFAQDQSSLDGEATVWETLWDTGALNLPETIQVLHQFLFIGDAVEKKVGDLSGGERTRLALCRLLVSRPNLLLLDEPTNHLDLPTREVLEQALRAYTGALVVVSHDRYFLSAVATRVLELRDGMHRHFTGTFQQWRERAAAGVAPAVRGAPARRSTPAAPPPERPRKLSPARRLPRLEAEIAQREERLKAVTALLGEAATWTAGNATELNAEYESLNGDLEALYAEWAEVAEQAAVE